MESKYEFLGKSQFQSKNPSQNSNIKFSTYFGKRKLNCMANDLENVLMKKSKCSSISKSSVVTSRCSIEYQRQSLPIYACKDRILLEIRKSDTLLIMGETGTGKTTQIPQFLLMAGYAQSGMIGVTQPRRVAAVTIAKRVAQENGCKLGELIGYSVRFEDCTSPLTRIRFLTDGMLLREALSDRLLKKYTVLMLDEAHERTINNDVLFGIVKEAQRQRKMQNLVSLKLIITSATMDIDHFSKYFGVRGMYLEGKTYSVKVMHAKKSQSDYLNAALVTLFDIHRSAPPNHDVLVFLTGQEEIENMAQQIRLIAKANNIGSPNVRVFPLYAQLPQNKQLDCFLPASPNSRKIILATNIAETSITIPGIRYVVDCGYAKQRIFNAESCLDILKIVRISQAQSWQRCGRAGRDAEGTCYRTYTKYEMEQLEPMSKPEILRSNLSATVLQLLQLNVDSQTFDFLDRPSFEALNIAHKKLMSLGAINKTDNTELTPLGRQMALFPLDPKYSKLILTAPTFGCMEEILSIVALLSGDNIYVSTTEKRELAALAHAKFESRYGDHLTLLNVFNAFQKSKKVKLWCHDNFLNARNLAYAREVRKQLMEIAEGLELQIKSCENNFDCVRKCLLVGLCDNIAELQRDNLYLTLSGRQRAKIHPSSVLHGKYNPDYIIFSDIVLTDRNLLRLITEIEPEWINDVFPTYCHSNKRKTQ